MPLKIEIPKIYLEPDLPIALVDKESDKVMTFLDPIKKIPMIDMIKEYSILTPSPLREGIRLGDAIKPDYNDSNDSNDPF